MILDLMLSPSAKGSSRLALLLMLLPPPPLLLLLHGLVLLRFERKKIFPLLCWCWLWWWWWSDEEEGWWCVGGIIMRGESPLPPASPNPINPPPPLLWSMVPQLNKFHFRSSGGLLFLGFPARNERKKEAEGKKSFFLNNDDHDIYLPIYFGSLFHGTIEGGTEPREGCNWVMW